MKIALAQINSTVGDIAGNEAKHAAAIARALESGAALVVFPEMSLLGYPPRDLVERRGVAEACLAAAERLAASVPAGALVLVGLPVASQVAPIARGGRPFANALALLRGGRIEGFATKQLLPSYDVFDEDRHYAPGASTTVVEHAGERIAALLCEDLWQAGDARSARHYAHDPVAEARARGATVIAVASASPFVAGKDATHGALLADRARAAGAVVASVNAVGGQDDLVFDGGSRVLSATGATLGRCARFAEDLLVVDTAAPAALRGLDAGTSGLDAGFAGSCDLDAGFASSGDLDAERFHAIVLGTRDYLAKTGHRAVLLGLSGGIDSALVAAIAAAAIGPANVTGILMPSRYSSDGSLTDARETARLLGLGRIETLAIDAIHRAVESTAAGAFSTDGLAGENLQSRARGLLVMLASNATGALVLTTGNKSEYAAGYATLYGDMNGGLAPIGDLYKTEVYAMARMLNARFAEFGFARPPIPAASIDKAPSAELRPNQTDQDSLPPYDLLDAVLRVLIDAEGSVDEAVAASGAPRELVGRIARMLDRAQFKRDQAAVILKLAPRAFGRGRRYPIAQRWDWSR
ncbi:MAG: NAD+ synthase [Phycisphaerales bacterium]